MTALQSFLRSRLGAFSQIIVIVVAALVLRGHSPLFTLPSSLAAWLVVPLALIALGLMWLAGDSWRSLGFGQPTEPLARWMIEGVVAGVLCGLVAAGLLIPLLNQGEGVTSGALTGDVTYLITSLILRGAIAAVAKGLAYRAFLLNRLEILLGSSRSAVALAIIIAAVVFGLSSLDQGLATVSIVTVVGLVFNLLYYWSRRNVWSSILAHGTYNATLFVLVFLGRL